MKNLGHGSTRVPVAAFAVGYVASGRQQLLNNSPVQHPLFSVPGFGYIVSMRKLGICFIVNECIARSRIFFDQFRERTTLVLRFQKIHRLFLPASGGFCCYRELRFPAVARTP
jgi:hypothetical protein